MRRRIWARLSGISLTTALAVSACGGRSSQSPHERLTDAAGQANVAGGSGGSASTETRGGAGDVAGTATSAGAPAEAAGAGGEGGARSEPYPLRIQQVATGTDHVCVLDNNQRVKCWGNNLVGQLGYGDTVARGLEPSRMGDALPYVDLGTGRTAKLIAAGYRTTCALLDDDSVKCWGNDLFAGTTEAPPAHGDEPGEMGDALVPVAMPHDAPVSDLAVGHFQACAAFRNDSFWCGTRSATPYFIPALDISFTDVIAGGYVIATYTDRSARSLIAGNVPQLVIATDVQLAAASVHYYCFAYTDGSGKCLGDQGFDVSQDMRELRDLAVTVSGILCGVRGDGEVRCWGNLPPDLVANAPQGAFSIPLTRPALQLSGGGDGYLCALLEDATVECWNWGTVPLAAVGNDSVGSARLAPVDLGRQGP